MRFVSCPTCGRQFVDRVTWPHEDWRRQPCPPLIREEPTMPTRPDCPGCEAIDHVYDEVQRIAANLSRDANERDAEAYLLDALHLLAKAADALARSAAS